MFNFLRRIGVTACVIFLSSCVAPAPTQVAAPELVQSVHSQTVPSGKARVLFYLGEIEGNMMFSVKMDVPGSGDLYANDRFLGGINKGEIAAFDLPPGHYEFKWQEGSHSDDGLVSTFSAVDLKVGDTVYLRADMYQTTSFAVGPSNSYTSNLKVCQSGCQVDFNNLEVVTAAK